jgi:hypothetical protein
MPKQPSKASKKKQQEGDAPTRNSDMPKGEKFREKLTFRKLDPWGGCYFTPTAQQYDRLKEQAAKRHPYATLPVFYDNFDDKMTVRGRGRKEGEEVGWDDADRLVKGNQYIVHGMMRTASVAGSVSTFIRITRVEGELAEKGEVEGEEGEEKPKRKVKRKLETVAKHDKDKKKRKKKQDKDEDEDAGGGDEEEEEEEEKNDEEGDEEEDAEANDE